MISADVIQPQHNRWHSYLTSLLHRSVCKLSHSVEDYSVVYIKFCNKRQMLTNYQRYHQFEVFNVEMIYIGYSILVSQTYKNIKVNFLDIHGFFLSREHFLISKLENGFNKFNYE